MWKWLRRIFFGIGILLVLFLVFMLQPWVFLPHRHIEITLPVEPADDAVTSLIPMGEKIEHNESNGNPNGHPGIDLGGWNKETRIVSVADGRVTRISKAKTGTTTVEVQSGFYRNVYQELNKVAPGLRWFSKVKKGQLIGYAGYWRAESPDRPPEFPSGQIHWDFASSSILIDRLCPYDYFDTDAKKRVDAIWAHADANNIFKPQYPKICNGWFEGRVD